MGIPEGDTIHRAAERLRPALTGATVVRFGAPRLLGDRPKPGAVIESVEARGKNLLVHFAGGLTLRTHMRMTGSWHLYRAGERWRKSSHLARVAIELDNGWVAVCFQAPVVETYARAGTLPIPLATLGPDLCEPDVDIDAVVERLAAVAPTTEIADALLDQRIAAGVGNVYKSEVLWACHVDPFTPVGVLDDATRRRIYSTMHQMLRANLGGGPRVTHQGGLAVYGRVRQPCPRCGTPVRSRRQGELARTTYWCPQCQTRQPEGS